MTRDEAIAFINDELGIQGGVTIRGDEVKCYLPDDEGGTYKAYLTAADCQALADAFGFLALGLETQVQGQAKGESDV